MATVDTASVDTASRASSERFPGWYADPMTPTMERFWDGLRWTSRVRVGADLAEDLGPIDPVLASYLAG